MFYLLGAMKSTIGLNEQFPPITSVRERALHPEAVPAG